MKLTTGHTRRHGKGIMSHEQILYFALKGCFHWGIGFGETEKCHEMIKAGLLKRVPRPPNWSRRDGDLYVITKEGKQVYECLRQSHFKKEKIMLNTVQLKGFVAPLQTAISDQKFLERLNDYLYNKKSNLRINSEGTLIYSSKRNEDVYGLTLEDLSSLLYPSRVFISDCRYHSIGIVQESIRPFEEIYYNDGEDPSIDSLTLRGFVST